MRRTLTPRSPPLPQPCTVFPEIHLSNQICFLCAKLQGFPLNRRLCSLSFLRNATCFPTNMRLCTCSRTTALSAYIAVISSSVNDMFTKFSPGKNGVCTTQVCGASYMSGYFHPWANVPTGGGACAMRTNAVSALNEQTILYPQIDRFQANCYTGRRTYQEPQTLHDINYFRVVLA